MNYYEVLAFLCMLLWVIKIATVQVIIIIIIIISHFGNSVTVKLPARFSWSQVLSYPPPHFSPHLVPHCCCWQQLKVEPSSLNIHEAITLTQSCAFFLYKMRPNSWQIKCVTRENCHEMKVIQVCFEFFASFSVKSQQSQEIVLSNNPFEQSFQLICAVLSKTHEI